MTRTRIATTDAAWARTPLAGVAPMTFGLAQNLLTKGGIFGGARVLVVDAATAAGTAAAQLAVIAGASATVLGAPAAGPVAGVHYLAPGHGPAAMHFDLVVDLVCDPDWCRLLDALRPGRLYARPGAIAPAARGAERHRV